MLRLIFVAFLVAHGLVHLLYVGQSRRLHQLGPDMTWPDDSWAFSKLLGTEPTRLLASVAYILSAIGFVVGGVGMLLGQPWSRWVVAGAAAFSSLSVLLLWDGRMRKLTEQGLIALIINAAILALMFILQWPVPE